MKRLFIALFLLLSVIALACDDNFISLRHCTCGEIVMLPDYNDNETHYRGKVFAFCPNNKICEICGGSMHNLQGICENIGIKCDVCGKSYHDKSIIIYDKNTGNAHIEYFSVSQYKDSWEPLVGVVHTNCSMLYPSFYVCTVHAISDINGGKCLFCGESNYSIGRSCVQREACTVCGKNFHEPLGCINANGHCDYCGITYHAEFCPNSENQCGTCGAKYHGATCPYEKEFCLTCNTSIHNENRACPNLQKTCDVCRISTHNETLICPNYPHSAVEAEFATAEYILTTNSPLSFSIPSIYTPDKYAIHLEVSTSKYLESADFTTIKSLEKFQVIAGEAYHFGKNPFAGLELSEDTVITVRTRITEKEIDGVNEFYTAPKYYKLKNRKGLK